ncbi:hypothetical protein DL95DRAFT_451846 [Leptodontidium sp. 2 PMI_412]|nr:hypothetical protein DL95DRAFT_451846 [Leptodontidium sp. 2 PMI_412]
MDKELSIGGGAWSPSGGAAGPLHHRRSRSSHSKSRTGCLTCKFRRVKCDETRPVCTNCSSRKTVCSYPPELRGEANELFPPKSTAEALAQDNMLPPGLEAPLPDSKKRSHRDQLDSNNGGGLSFPCPDSGSRAAANQISNQAPKPQSVESISWGGIASFSLLSGFITQTYATLSLLETKQRVWKGAVVELSSTSECLMHALLAVSAAHMYYLENEGHPDVEGSQGQALFASTSPNPEASALHHNIAVSLMRKEVASLTDGNVQQIFAASTVLVAYSFATSRTTSRQEGPQLTWSNLEWFRLTRGISSITAQAWPALRMGPLRRLLDVRIIHEDWKTHLQGRMALHRESSVPIQLPQPTYMQLKELTPIESSPPLPQLQPNTSSSLCGSGNPAHPSHFCEPSHVPNAASNSLLFKQLTNFRRGAVTAISELLAVCDAETEQAGKGRNGVEVEEGGASTPSGVGVDETSTTRAQSGIQAACRVLKDLYIRILLIFQHSSFGPKRRNGSKSTNDESCTQALQEIEEIGGLAWPAMVPEDYVRELCQTIPNADVLEGEGLKIRARLRCNRAKALVILAYYKVLLVLLESGFWWLHKFGESGISSIANEVKECFGQAVEIYTTIAANGDGLVMNMEDEIGRVKSEAKVWVGLLEWPNAFVAS